MDSVAARAFVALLDADADYAEEVTEELEEHYTDTWGWANIVADTASGANVICFHSGWGDGFYASYFGYDDAGAIVCLLTDFGVIAA